MELDVPRGCAEVELREVRHVQPFAVTGVEQARLEREVGNVELMGVAIRRFRLAENVYLPVLARGITVILGQNDAGKSTILDAVASLAQHELEDGIVVAYFRAPDAAIEIPSSDDADQRASRELIRWIEEHTDFGTRSPLFSGPLEPLTNHARDLLEAARTEPILAVSAYGPESNDASKPLTRWLAVPAELELDARTILERLAETDADWLTAELVLRRFLDTSEGAAWWEVVATESTSSSAVVQYEEIRNEPAARELFAAAPAGRDLVNALLAAGPALRFLSDRVSEPWLRESLLVPVEPETAPLGDVLALTTRPGDLDQRLRELCDRIAEQLRQIEIRRDVVRDEPWLERLWELQRRGLISEIVDAESSEGWPKEEAATEDEGEEDPYDNLLLSRVPSLRSPLRISETQPWFVVQKESPYRLQRMVEIDRMVREVETIATSLLPPFLAEIGGQEPQIVVDLGEGYHPSVRVRWGVRDPVPVDQIAEGYRLWVVLAVRCAIRHIERWLEREWAFNALVGLEYGPAEFRQLRSVGRRLPRDRLTHFKAPQLRDLIVLIDEPERHLHPAAQRAAARWLRRFAMNWEMTVMLATHAPAFLAIDDARYNEVRRNVDGHMILEPVDPRELKHQQELAARLGFDRGELSHQYRAILLVEGAHEELVLGEWFADDLQEARVLLLPIRGTRNLGSITWALEGLLRFIELPVGFLFDEDETTERIAKLVRRLKDVPASRRNDLLNDGEKKVYRRYGEFVNLLAYGHLKGRVLQWSHKKPDIVFFLDEKQFQERSGGYTHAEAEARIHERGNTGIKPWLEKTWKLGGDFFDDDNIRRMAREGEKSDDPTLLRVIQEICAWANAE